MPADTPPSETTVTPADWHTAMAAMSRPSMYDHVPATIAVELLHPRFPVGHQVPAPRTPSVPDALIRDAWSRHLDVERAVTLVALCGDTETLEWILARDRRKAVRLAVIANPALCARVLWDPQRGAALAEVYERHRYLSNRIADVDVDDFAEMLSSAPAQQSTALRKAIMADPRLDGARLTEVLNTVYATTAARFELDPLSRFQVNNVCTEAALYGAAARRDPLPLGLVESMVTNTTSVEVATVLALSIDTAHAMWLIERLDAATPAPEHLRNHYGNHTVYEAMATRVGMPQEWYRLAAQRGGSGGGDTLAANPCVDPDVLRDCPTQARVAFARLGTAVFGEDTIRWSLAIESLDDEALPTLGDLVDYVETACI